MKFTCEKKDIYKVNSIVQKASINRTTLPILEGIRIIANEKNQSLKLMSNNLEMAIEYEFYTNVIEGGTIVINSKFFGDVIKKLPDESSITFICNPDNNINIISGSAKFKIIGYSSAEFPDMPILESDKKFQINQNTLKDMLKKTYHAISSESHYPILSGVLFEINNKYLNIVTVDGYRLAIRREPIMDCIINESFVMPSKTVNELIKILKDEDIPVTLNFNDRHVMFCFEKFKLVSNLLKGNFFDYKKAIPDEYRLSLKINPRILLQSIECASLVIENDKLSHILRLDFDNNIIKVSSSNTHAGYYDKMNVGDFGEKILIGLNIRYMLDALRNCHDDEVILKLNSSLTPLIITPSKEQNFLFLVVPARL
ncbi:MAG: DNA polymerase III subunit beta [Nitrososphaeraceae archaeon]